MLFHSVPRKCVRSKKGVGRSSASRRRCGPAPNEHSPRRGASAGGTGGPLVEEAPAVAAVDAPHALRAAVVADPPPGAPGPGHPELVLVADARDREAAQA